MRPIPVITVDGPGGVGKGTLCCFLANKLGWHFLDSGGLYRGLAYAARRRDVALDDIDRLASLAADLHVRFEFSKENSAAEIILDDRKVGDELRTEECANAASIIAAIAEVRAALLGRQRAFSRSPGLIADGRDMGTVVFPDAPCKIYLTAPADERAKRRYKQLKQKGIDANLLELSVDIAERDARDGERGVSPLKPAGDARIIDTAGLDVEAVRQIVWDLVVQTFNDRSVYSRC